MGLLGPGGAGKNTILRSHSEGCVISGVSMLVMPDPVTMEAVRCTDHHIRVDRRGRIAMA